MFVGTSSWNMNIKPFSQIGIYLKWTILHFIPIQLNQQLTCQNLYMNILKIYSRDQLTSHTTYVNTITHQLTVQTNNYRQAFHVTNIWHAVQLYIISMSFVKQKSITSWQLGEDDVYGIQKMNQQSIKVTSFWNKMVHHCFSSTIASHT